VWGTFRMARRAEVVSAEAVGDGTSGGSAAPIVLTSIGDLFMSAVLNALRRANGS
jgi:hypothetical protein